MTSTTTACSPSRSAVSPTQMVGSVQPQYPTVDLVTIPIGIDPNEPTQMRPYFLDTGEGHFLFYGMQTHKLIYDGQEIYSGDLVGLYSAALSLSYNGLHYAYITPASDGRDFNDLYVDGVKVATAQYLSQPAVTDDGRHYFYTACTSATGFSGTCLFKDAADIFLNGNGILEYSISADGSTYYALVRDAANHGDSLVRNGEGIYSGMEPGDKAFSRDGKHYGYVSLDEAGMQYLIVDGAVKRSSTALALEQITDLGSYCAWDAARKLVVVNGTEFPVVHDGHVRCYINNDASHSLIYDDGSWLLDGKPAKLPDLNPNDKIEGVEMAEDIWYIYRLVQ